jgi:hypothetical protein
VVELL